MRKIKTFTCIYNWTIYNKLLCFGIMKRYMIIVLFVMLPLYANANELKGLIKEDGFNTLTWVRNLATITGMKRIETDVASEAIKEYTHSDDLLDLDGTKLKQIRYTFWRNSLYAVTILTEGHDNYLALKKMVLELFDKSYQRNGSKEQYVWSNSKTDFELEYIDHSQKGKLQMKSKNMVRQIELTKYIKPKAYSNWIKWKRLKKK